MANQPEEACCHLDASAQVIRLLVQDCERMKTPLSPGPDAGENSYVYAALPHIISSLLRRDTLIAAGSRQAPRFDSDLTAWLISKTESSSAGMTDMISLLRETTALDAWKSLCIQRGQLSHFELVEKASKIQCSLQTLCEDAVSSTISEHSALRTSFGYATLVYLHLAVSGPTAPEIEHCLAKALEALQFLASCNGLASVIWPLCVVGSLAKGTQRNFFTGLKDSIDSTTQKTWYYTPHLFNALCIVNKCWESFDSADQASAQTWAAVSHELDIRCAF